LLKKYYTDFLNSVDFAHLVQNTGNQDLDWGKLSTCCQECLLDSQGTGLPPTLAALQNRWGMRYLKYFGSIASVLDLDEVRQQFMPLTTLATVSRGFTSGANEFFYLPKEIWKKWKIEEEFLAPILKSPRELSSICIPASIPLAYRIFFCQKPKKKLAGTNALRYIEEFGEVAEVTLKGRKVIGFQSSETCLARALWYALPPHHSAPIVIQKGFADKFAVHQNRAQLLVDQTFYEVYPHDDACVEPLLAVMNSTVGIFELLRISTTGLGGGLYRPTVNEIRTISLPDVRELEGFRLPAGMKNRSIRSVYEECGLESSLPFQNQTPAPLPDRAELDGQIFDFLNLPRDLLPDLYRSVCELVRQRMQKATKKIY
jgi:hypothetical protein